MKFTLHFLVLLFLTSCESKKERIPSTDTSPVEPTAASTGQGGGGTDTTSTTGSNNSGATTGGSNPVNGGWGAWTQWSICDLNCQKKRWRFCDNPSPQNGGLTCSGPTQEIASCTPTECQGNSDGGSGTESTCPSNFFKVKEVATSEHFVSTPGYGTVNYCFTDQSPTESFPLTHCHIHNNFTYCHLKTIDSNALFYKVPTATNYNGLLLDELKFISKKSYVLPLNTCNFPALMNIPEREKNKMKQLFGFNGGCPSQKVLCESNHVKSYDSSKSYIAIPVMDAASKSSGIIYLKREDSYAFPNLAGMYLGSESRKIASYILQICLTDQSNSDILTNDTKLTIVQEGKGYLHQFNFNSNRMHAVRVGEFWNYSKGSLSMLLDPILNYTMPANLDISCRTISSEKYKWRLGYISNDPNAKVICTKNAAQTIENVQSCEVSSEWIDWNNKKWCLSNSSNNQYFIAKGVCTPCPHGGTHDGANCLLGYLPNTGKIVNKKAYYHKTKPAPVYCETGDTLSTSTDSSAGMCHRTSIIIHPTVDSFMLNNNTIYYKPLCNIVN